MADTFENYNSVYAKRLVLVADDEQVNRELLGAVLKDDYRVIYAEDGEDAYEKIRENKETLSIILLDLIMPKMHGLALLRILRDDPKLCDIPVIVLTTEQSAEVESLRLGAVDFIPKPYPQPEVILARVARTIQLSEGKSIIDRTERDQLTGLYNKEYFYRYAQSFDSHHRETAMDAVVMNLNQFHTINERFGKAYGDEVLRRLAERSTDVFSEFGGIICRSESDTFMAYCPHRSDYKTILDKLSVGLAESDLSKSRIRLRMGVYTDVDKSIDIERRFDRAKMAADNARSSFAGSIAFYDSALHESELYTQQLLEDFHKAIESGEFKVYYQPKFDIHPAEPVLASAEALVRWQHPAFGMISPAIFIPVFENNGLIPELDTFVWREAARQIRDWKERFGAAVPISVNVSRVDMYDPHLADTLMGIIGEFGLTPGELLLEITESAYTNDAEQIIKTVNTLRELGFFVEMDDFGTGYSSLNMISTLPIDALKLDRQFIHNAFSEKRDTRMLEVIIDIADYLSVPVIAEGVETLEQLHALKAMGCDIVQGFYFSRPVPAEDFEKYLQQGRSVEETSARARQENSVTSTDLAREVSYGRIANALSGGFESIYYVDTENDHYVEYSSQGKYEDLQIQRSGTDFFADTRVNLRRVVYKEDQARMAEALTRETILAHLEDHDHFAMTYRLMIDGKPAYYSLKAVRSTRKGARHLVIGVSNVDEQVRSAVSADGGQTAAAAVSAADGRAEGTDAGSEAAARRSRRT